MIRELICPLRQLSMIRRRFRFNIVSHCCELRALTSLKRLPMITELRLKIGSSLGQPPLVVKTPPSITIFVGPNNSGKSQILQEIYGACITGQFGATNMLLEGLRFASLDEADARAELEKRRSPSRPGDSIHPNHSYIDNDHSRHHVQDLQYIRALVRPDDHAHVYAAWHLSRFVLNLNGPARANLLAPQGRGNLLTPTTSFTRLYMDNAKRAAVRKVVLDAIGFHIGIDAYTTDQLHLRFGSKAPPNERHHDDETTEWLSKARDITQVSDGVKAFTGILMEVYAGDRKIIVVDEPEAFLHPSLAHKLGHELAKGAATEQKHVLAATHSSHFVMGAILSGAQVNIVRLTYSDGIATARHLENSTLVRLMNDPLLRSVGVLTGLFYDHVIVGEADADRAFYEEVNHRLLSSDDPRGIPHCLFLNADGKATVPRIVAPLRMLGIPAAGIVDIDVVKEGGGEWTKHLEACNWPVLQREACHRHRHAVYDALKSAAPAGQKADEYFKIHGGVALLPKADRESANNLFDGLDSYGYFVVRGGEVESWLPELNVPRGKKGPKGWRAAIFAAMGSNPTDQSYVKPTQGDVWDFIGNMRAWMANATRKGIPD